MGRIALIGSVLLLVALAAACSDGKGSDSGSSGFEDTGPGTDPEPDVSLGEADVPEGEPDVDTIEPEPKPEDIVEVDDEVQPEPEPLPVPPLCKSDDHCSEHLDNGDLDDLGSDCSEYICDYDGGEEPGECVGVLISGCCVEVGQCLNLELEPCHQRACVDGQCVLQEIEDCCTTDADCDDLADGCCTEATCGGSGQCVVTTKSNCCAESTDCPDGPGGVEGICEEACVEDGCVLPAPGCETNIQYIAQDFDSGSLGLTSFDNDPEDPVTIQAVNSTSVSPSWSAYFGRTDCWNYYSGELDEDTCEPTDPFAADTHPLDLRLSSQEISLDADSAAYLGFWIRMCAEDALEINLGNGPEVLDTDYFVAEVTSGGETTEIWRSTDTDALGIDNCTKGEWLYQTASLQPYQGKSVTLRFRFITDGNAEFTPLGKDSWEGVYLDSVVLATLCDEIFCSDDADCEDDLDACTENSCTSFALTGGGVCGYQATTPGEDCESCAVPADCGSDACFDYECNEGICGSALKPECCVPTSTFPKTTTGGEVAFEGFEAGISAWTIDDPYETDSVGWQVHTVLPQSGSSCLYFGDPTTETYVSDQGHPATATAWSPWFQVPASPFQTPMLSFWLWLSTEYDGKAPPEPDTEFDILTIWAKDQDTGASTMIFNSAADIGGTTNLAYEQVGIDMTAYAGQGIQLGFTFDSGDDTKNDLGGARIDELTLTSICGGECISAANCDDADPCTADWCDLGTCISDKTDPLCCDEKADCNDDNNCTLDSCSEEGQCVQAYDLQKVSTCCSEGPWVHEWAADFENGPQGFTTEALTPPVAWHLTTDTSNSGVTSFNFSDPSTGTYENPEGGASEGLLISPPVEVPPFQLGHYYAQFWFLLETEWDENDLKYFDGSGLFTIDDLTVEVAVDGATEGATEMWWSGYVRNTTLGTWVMSRVDLTDWTSEEVQLVFRFDTGDSAKNYFAGPFVDDVTFGTTCKPNSAVQCIYGGDCDEPDDAECQAAVCTPDYKCVEEPIDDPVCCEPYVNGAMSVGFEPGSSECPVIELAVPEGDDPAPEPVCGQWSSLRVIPGGAPGDPDSTWQCATDEDIGEEEGLNPHNGEGMLYFGNGAHYGLNQGSAGKAWSAPVTLLDDIPWGVEFWLYADIETPSSCSGGGPPFADVFTIWIQTLEDAESCNVISETKVFSKEDLECNQFGNWQLRGISLTEWAGKTIRWYFDFTTFDGISNSGTGIAIDHFEYTQGCPEL